jgi:hypothetical protein
VDILIFESVSEFLTRELLRKNGTRGSLVVFHKATIGTDIKISIKVLK